MLRKIFTTAAAATLVWFATAGMVVAQDLQRDYDQDYNNDPAYTDNIRIDRYLDAEVWTNHLDGDFYVGDNVVINYRTSRDAFVAIYSIDSKGRVNLLFPADPSQDNFVRGGVTNYLPGAEDDFDLVVSGPEGVENIQIIASRERFPIPDWYPVSGLVCDWDDRFDYMDFLNNEYFVRYGGQKFAFDRTAMYVNEWEPTYYRPVYYPYYPSWTVCGNAYIDYPWGSTIYVDGIYWGITPLFIPRIYVGWHTITVYDRWGSCWEHDVHFSHYHTVILNRDIIRPAPQIRSKYKDVVSIGYRDPVNNGYPSFKQRSTVVSKVTGVKQKATNVTTRDVDYQPTVDKRYVRGSTKLIATDRGYETSGAIEGRSRDAKGKYTRTTGVSGKAVRTVKGGGGNDLNSGSGYGGAVTGDKGSSGGKKVESRQPAQQSKGYYQKKSGDSSPAKTKQQQPQVKQPQQKGKTGGKTIIKSKPSSGKSGGATKSTTVKQPSSKPRSGSGTTKTSTPRVKSGGGKSKKGGGR